MGDHRVIMSVPLSCVDFMRFTMGNVPITCGYVMYKRCNEHLDTASMACLPRGPVVIW